MLGAFHENSSYYPYFMDYLREREDFLVSQLRSVNPNDTAEIARIQGKLDLLKTIMMKPEQSYRASKEDK